MEQSLSENYPSKLRTCTSRGGWAGAWLIKRDLACISRWVGVVHVEGLSVLTQLRFLDVSPCRLWATDIRPHCGRQ